MRRCRWETSENANESEQWTFINVSSWRDAFMRYDRGFPHRNVFCEIIFFLSAPRFSAPRRYQSARLWYLLRQRCRCRNASTWTKRNYCNAVVAVQIKVCIIKVGTIESRSISSEHLSLRLTCSECRVENGNIYIYLVLRTSWNIFRFVVGNGSLPSTFFRATNCRITDDTDL